MVIEDSGFLLFFVVWPAKSAAMGKLKADEEIVGIGEMPAVGIEEIFQEMPDALFGPGVVVVDHANLVWIGSAVGLNGEGFPAPDELCAGLTEMPPAADAILGGLAIGGTIPPFHGVYAPAISNGKTAN